MTAMDTRPKFVMLVGMPGVGKSTYRAKHFSDYVQVSSDDFIEDAAKHFGITYNEAFKDNIDAATEVTKSRIKESVEKNLNIVLDRTSMTEKGRRTYLQLIPEGYKKIAYVFTLPPLYDDPDVLEWNKRLDRPGKTIPGNVLMNMWKGFTLPDIAEGFDEIHQLSWKTHTERSVTTRII